MKKSPFRSLSLAPLALVCVALVLASGARGDVPRTISYQGFLTDDAGAPLTGPVDVTFRLFGQLAEGTEAWSETHSGVQLDEGRFTVALGSVTALGVDFSQQMYLEIQVGDELLTPRLPMHSAPSAIRAATVDAGAVNTAALATGAVTKAKLGDDLAGAGLAQNADGSLKIASGGVAGAMLADGAVGNRQVADDADIAPTKIAGTAVTLDGTEVLTNKTLTNPVLQVRDSDFTIVDDDDPGYSVRLQLSAPGRAGGPARTLLVPDADGTLALESYVDAEIAALATVAASGAYADLAGLPALATVATSGAYGDLAGTPTLATVATSGKYVDLVGLPALAAVATSGAYGDLADTPTLATVATSGTFADLVAVPNFAELDTQNTFTAPEYAISLAPVGATANAVLLEVISQEDRAVLSVFNVDTEGDVVAASYTGNGSALTNLTAGNMPGLALIATTGSFLDLAAVPDFARRDQENAFTASIRAISLEPADASADAPILQLLGGTERAGRASPVFVVDAEGDVTATTVTAESFKGDGAGLDSLDAGKITSGTLDLARLPSIPGSQIDPDAVVSGTIEDGTIVNDDIAAAAGIEFSKLDIQNGDITRDLLEFDSFTVSYGANFMTGFRTSTSVQLGGTLGLYLDTVNLAGELGGWGLMAAGSELAIDLPLLAPALAAALPGKGLTHDAADDTITVDLGAGLKLSAGNLVVPDVDDVTIEVDGGGKLAVKSIDSVPVVLDTAEPAVPKHGSLIYKDGALQVYDDPDGPGGDDGVWIKVGTYQ